MINTMTNDELVIDNLSVTFERRGNPTVHALQEISMSIRAGELVVVLGASGCGKTTLLNVIAGFQPATHGYVFVNDQKVTNPGADRGVVFQKNALMPWLNVSKNIELGLKFQHIPKSKRQEISNKTLELVGLGGFGNRPIYELSGGMQQRVGLARALASDPSILLMDEPLGALDALTREGMQELILRIWKRTEKTIFLITHSVEEAVFMATRLIIMTPSPGRVTKSFDLNFCEDFITCGDARKVKSTNEFIAVREQALSIIMNGNP